MTAPQTPRVHVHFGVGERWALASAFTYALLDVLLRAAAPSIDPWVAALVTMVPLVVVTWLLLARSGFREIRPGHELYLGGREIAGLMVGGIGGYVVGNVLFISSLAIGGLAIGVNALQGGVVWGGMALGLVVLHERPTVEQMVGGVIIVVGLALIAVSRLDAPGDGWFVGLLLAIAAGAAFASTNVFTRNVQRNRSAIVGVLACTAAGGFVPLVAVVGGRLLLAPAAILDGLQARDVLVVLGSGILSVMAMAGVAQAARHARVATVNAITASAVVYTLLASVVLFDEPAPPLMFVGVAGVLGGILFGQTTRRSAERSGAEPGPVSLAAVEQTAAGPED